MPLTLNLKSPSAIPTEVPGILPEFLQGKPLAEIERLPVLHGNRQVPLGELFRVSGTSDQHLIFAGDLAGVHRIGAKLSAGTIEVIGNAGRHAGSEMRGGTLIICGSAGDWLGAEMHGGLIDVRGDSSTPVAGKPAAGDYVGANYAGSTRGMAGGEIIVRGAVGHYLGQSMRRGLIAVAGSAGDFVGHNMLAGTIVILGDAGERAGAGMRRGTIAVAGHHAPLLPTFRHACRTRPLALKLVYRRLMSLGLPIPPASLNAEVELFSGDLLESGRGELFLTNHSMESHF